MAIIKISDLFAQAPQLRDEGDHRWGSSVVIIGGVHRWGSSVEIIGGDHRWGSSVGFIGG